MLLYLSSYHVNVPLWQSVESLSRECSVRREYIIRASVLDNYLLVNKLITVAIRNQPARTVIRIWVLHQKCIPFAAAAFFKVFCKCMCSKWKIDEFRKN